MKISYNWLKDYLPVEVNTSPLADSPQKLGSIITSVGLELESLVKYEQITNGLQGLIVGEVTSLEQHPNADKLKVATVDNGKGEKLQIVCGATNIALGQKVVIAPVGTTLYPLNGEPISIKKAKLRGIESHGMICAEDEIGVGESHDGIIILPENLEAGEFLSDYYMPYSDWILEIGLTPNRIDAMSHIGTAKDICAYMSNQTGNELKTILPYKNDAIPESDTLPIEVVIENTDACQRYCGISISGITLAKSPDWLKNKLKCIGVRPVNNVVDITNFILHETGQPLHVFDADKIAKKKVIIKNLPANTAFVTLDNKERKLNAEDLLICNGDEEPMCLAGVFGGFESGVSDNTKNIFLESAWFKPSTIRKTSFRHNLRTEAAIRFEKGVDISNTLQVLRRAALLIREMAGGEFSSDIVDVYPSPKAQAQVTLSHNFLNKLSGKNYPAQQVNNILTSLGFSVISKNIDSITVLAPFSNPDITLPEDLVEEIMRIDGLDNIEIPTSVKISPAVETLATPAALKEKIANWLTGNGFFEIFTNSITNSKYYDEEKLTSTIKIINSLSEDLNILRPSMMATGLETVAHNINRKNSSLFLFEFGKTYSLPENGKYAEEEKLSLYFTGTRAESAWQKKEKDTEIYFVKGVCDKIFRLGGLRTTRFEVNKTEKKEFNEGFSVNTDAALLAKGGKINQTILDKFSLKQPVYYLEINWERLIAISKKNKISFDEIVKFPQVKRDLAIVINKEMPYQAVEDSIGSLRISRLAAVNLFDVFESEKIGHAKKSLAITFTFSDKEKTLTDKEVDGYMQRIADVLEKENNAEIRRNN
ncbi:MAG: phenylalanine--tRNA ligase subunit beta [Ginsengibacter sp.]